MEPLPHPPNLSNAQPEKALLATCIATLGLYCLVQFSVGQISSWHHQAQLKRDNEARSLSLQQNAKRMEAYERAAHGDAHVRALEQQVRDSNYRDGQAANDLAKAYLEKHAWHGAIDATFFAPNDEDRQHRGLLHCTRARAYASVSSPDDIQRAAPELAMAGLELPKTEETLVRTREFVDCREKTFSVPIIHKLHSEEQIHHLFKCEADAARFMREQNYSGVIAATTEAMADYPNGGGTLSLSRAEAFHHLNRFDDAIHDYLDQVRGCYYHDGDSANKLALIYLEQNKWHDAIEATFLGQGDGHAEDAGWLCCTRARAYVHLNDMASANHEVEQAKLLLPANDDTLVKTAKFLDSMRQKH